MVEEYDTAISSRWQSRLWALILAASTIYFVLLVFNSVTRTGRFSPDSMNYVNVARNIVAGKGITQPTLGFNQVRFGLDEKPPSPFISQSPLYPILIALLSRVSISPERAALLLSSGAAVLVILLTYALAAELYDRRVALLAAAGVLFYQPLGWIAHYAWTDGVGIAFMLLALWLFVSKRETKGWILVCAGLASGLAFATRYAFLPIFFAGVLVLLVTDRSPRQKLYDLFLYAAGWALPAGLVWTRNFLVSGAIMPSFNHDGAGLAQNAVTAFRVLLENYSGSISARFQPWLLGMSIVAICLIFAIRREPLRSLSDLLFSNRRYILVVWSAIYLTFLIVSRSSSYFDLDARVVAPAAVTLIILCSALALRAMKIPGSLVSTLVLVALLYAVWREARITAQTPPFELQRAVHSSEQLSWIAANTSDQDLIMGDDTIDIPFYLHHEPTVSFSAYPYTDHATYEKIIAYARRHCGEYRNIYLVLRRSGISEAEYKSWYGDFFRDLMFAEREKYRDVVLLQALRDGFIFRIHCL